MDIPFEFWEPHPEDKEGNNYIRSHQKIELRGVRESKPPLISLTPLLPLTSLVKSIPLNGTIFVFYSKSANKYPGMGANEYIPPELVENYRELSKITDWRKMLSNFYLSPFELRGKRWASVEHYYQGSKFRLENPQFYALFSLDSGSELSKDARMAKSAGGKTGKIGGKKFRPNNIQIDKDFFSTTRHTEEMNIAQQAKFSISNLAYMLSLTKGAILRHDLGRGQGFVDFTYLMQLRDSR